MRNFRDFINVFIGEKSKDTAKERLKFVLVHDRANVSPELLNSLKADLMEVLSKYTEIDSSELDIAMTRLESDDGDRIVPALVANIPIKGMKVREAP